MTRWSQDPLPLWPPRLSEERLPFPYGLSAHEHLAALERAELLARKGTCRLCGGAPLTRGYEHRAECPITVRARRRAGEKVPRSRPGPPSCGFCGVPRDGDGRIEHSPRCRVLVRRDTLSRAS